MCTHSCWSLGRKAKPLEQFVREQVEKGSKYAETALGDIHIIDEESVIALTKAVIDRPYGEAAHALVRSGENDNPVVVSMIAGNEKALKPLEIAKECFQIDKFYGTNNTTR